MLTEIDKYQRKGKVKMKRKTLILGSIGGVLLFLLLKDVYWLIRLGWFLVLSPLLGAVLAVIAGLLMLWLLWR